MTEIEFYFDFASPYGFIAAMQAERIARPLRWRPFLLGAVYKAVGQSPLEHRLKRDYVINLDAPRMARRRITFPSPPFTFRCSGSVAANSTSR